MTILDPDPQAFKADPFGYSSLGWHKWGMAQTIAGFPVDNSHSPTTRDLKSPVLWMTHAHALSEAAVNVLRNEPNLENLPIWTKGVCHCQYHAVALMLVGLSLETCLKAMIIIRDGPDAFMVHEKEYKHHNLNELCKCGLELSEKDRAILDCLSHFIYWGGKYPDPGSGREKKAVAIFEISERFEISAAQLFDLAARVMGHAKKVVDESV